MGNTKMGQNTMSNEPFFITQCNEPMTPDQRRTWIEGQAKESKQQGSTFARVTVWPPNSEPEIILFEAWKERPEDQGEPRFHLSKPPYY